VKKYRKTLTVIIILIVAIMMFAAFFGVKKTNEKGEKINLIPDYKLGMEFGQTRVITATVDEEKTVTIYDSEGNVVEPEEGKDYKEEDGYRTVEQPVNAETVKTIENYEKAKKIIEERLEANNISQFFIEMDKKTGKITIEIPEDENADSVQDLIENSGSLILLDGETGEVVLDSSYLKEAQVVYSQGDLETAVFLQLSFNEEGTAKLQELNKIYVETTKTETDENGEEKEVTESKVVWVFLNDVLLGSTVLPNIVYDDTIMFTLGVSNDNKEIQEAVKVGEQDASLLNSGTSPIVYEYSNEIRETKIENQELFVFLVAIGAVFVLAYLYLVIKFKARGFISVYFQVGFLGILLLILKLTGEVITMEGMAGIVISMLLEYIFTYIVLSNIDKNEDGIYKKSNLTFFFNTLPVYIVAVVFTFANRAHISSFGTTLFWGILMIYVYNFIFSKYVFENLTTGGKNENN